MILRPRMHWLRMLLVLRGSVLLAIAPRLAAFTAFAVLVTLAHGTLLSWKISLNFVPFSLLGLTLAIFLGFRNSTSYARYWEARTLWGQLASDSRSLLRQSLAHFEGADSSRLLAMRLMAFIHCLRHQLRGSDAAPQLALWLDPGDAQRVAQARWRPLRVLQMLGEQLGDASRAAQVPAPLLLGMENTLNRLSDALSGCERIAGTPIPFTYAVLIHRTIYGYCLLLPFGLLDAIGPMTPVMVAFIAYTFFALEALGAEIEEPFGLEPNDLALDAMSADIEASLREMLGEVLPPPTPLPRGGVVLT